MALRAGVETLLRRYAEKSISFCVRSTYFHVSNPPSISIAEYFARLGEFMLCSEECFIAALIYLDRIQRNHAKVSVNSRSVHRFFLIAAVLAAKFLEDKFYTNAYYSQVGGVSTDEMNSLELEFLELIDFDLFISERDYQEYADELRDREVDMGT